MGNHEFYGKVWPGYNVFLVERNMTKFYKLVKTVNVNIADPLGMKPIHYVIRLYPDRLLIDVIRTLKENGADLNAKDKFGDRPM